MAKKDAMFENLDKNNNLKGGGIKNLFPKSEGKGGKSEEKTDSKEEELEKVVLKPFNVYERDFELFNAFSRYMSVQKKGKFPIRLVMREAADLLREKYPDAENF